MNQKMSIYAIVFWIIVITITPYIASLLIAFPLELAINKVALFKNINAGETVAPKIVLLVVALGLTYVLLKYIHHYNYELLGLTWNANSLFFFGRGFFFCLSILLPAIILCWSCELFKFSAWGIIYFSWEELTTSIFLNYLLGCLCSVIAEEILIRGYIFSIIHTNIQNVFGAAIISSIVFTSMHLSHTNWVSFLQIFVAGIVLAMLFYYSKSLYTPIGFHFGWNFLHYIFSYGAQKRDYPQLVYTTNFKITTSGITYTTIISTISIVVILVLVIVLKDFLLPKINSLSMTDVQLGSH